MQCLGHCVRSLALVLAIAAAPSASAQGPITILVGFAPGGATDLTARPIADPLRKSLGRPVTVQNRPGAGGIVAAEELKRALTDDSRYRGQWCQTDARFELE
ncbi:MAG TPA: tripartite tricarboxylate transporter substrate-binding protein [Casimicrobiaceae bacterium]|nr:tripartite tricarboxylate transporter substrate-binding protein [Casimicrobiaceae bacterium]